MTHPAHTHNAIDLAIADAGAATNTGVKKDSGAAKKHP
jgi:hypothetical protein